MIRFQHASKPTWFTASNAAAYLGITRATFVKLERHHNHKNYECRDEQNRRVWHRAELDELYFIVFQYAERLKEIRDTYDDWR